MAYQSALFKSMIEDLKSVGVVMDLRALEWGARLALINDRRFDAYNLAASTDPLFEDYYKMWYSSQVENKGRNRVGYVNPRVDEILETARVTFDDAERYALMREMHGILHEDQPMTGLFTPAVNAAINRRWRNVRIYEGRGVYVYDWWLPAENRKPTDTVPPR
jgi:peptide/nickel transport system substrate-binding protein